MKKMHLEEAVSGYTPTLAMEEASRCLLCLDAPCSASCPAGTDPAKFIRSIRFKNIKGAAHTIRINNPLGGICARVCPTEKYCQLACSRCGIDKPIDIGRLQRFATDMEAALKMKNMVASPVTGKKVAIIGSGPSGLTAAAMLAQRGIHVDIFEAKPKAGGYLRYGIPEYRLPEEVLDQEIKYIKDLGVQIICDKKVENVEELKKDYDAVIVAIGYSKGKSLAMFEGKKKAIKAVDFLEKVRKTGMKMPERVLVIGGGDVAMDVVTTAKKLGAAYVTDVVYETFEEFKASKEELALARKHNVSIYDGYIPVACTNSGVVTFKHRKMDASIKIKADLIVLAVGQEASPLEGMQLDHGEMPTRVNDIFYTGDLVAGDKTVVYAVRKGKLVALDVCKFLGVEA